MMATILVPLQTPIHPCPIMTISPCPTTVTDLSLFHGSLLSMSHNGHLSLSHHGHQPVPDPLWPPVLVPLWPPTAVPSWPTTHPCPSPHWPGQEKYPPIPTSRRCPPPPLSPRPYGMSSPTPHSPSQSHSYLKGIPSAQRRQDGKGELGGGGGGWGQGSVGCVRPPCHPHNTWRGWGFPKEAPTCRVTEAQGEEGGRGSNPMTFPPFQMGKLKHEGWEGASL